MQKTKVWSVEIDAKAGDTWSGLFLYRPTATAVQSAIWMDLVAAQQVVEEDEGDEEDTEYNCTHVERLLMTYEVAEQLDEDFLGKHGEQAIKVGGVPIGFSTVTELDALTN